ncbi:hypothetical protein K458DRAFT_196974 [Lentithecium fluviatile CBS 122367]|uniref:Uncharacterized protein n=1 Tax=Lentithecium fluviatile CBS 122367 TaxID=1168545 RepID=A0A6G1ICL3_9PLEO|nr:hypothetical protein K458DRAFT_196974 [Lentithecium fluviatile CBS 122367]
MVHYGSLACCICLYTSPYVESSHRGTSYIERLANTWQLNNLQVFVIITTSLHHHQPLLLNRRPIHLYCTTHLYHLLTASLIPPRVIPSLPFTFSVFPLQDDLCSRSLAFME